MDGTRWVVREGAHEPIVPKELWDKANLVRRERARGGSPRHYVLYLLSGLIKCGRCGFSFEGQSTSLRGRNYYRYVCGGYNWKRVCECTSVPRDRIETFLIDAIEDVLSGNLILSQVRSNLDAMVEESPIQDQTAMEKERARLQVCDEKAKRVLMAIEDGGPIPVLMGQLQKLQEEKSEAEMALQRFLIASGGEVDLDIVA